MTEPLAYRLHEAARVAAVSEGTLRRAIHATDPNTFPPPLRAKNTPKGYRVKRADLEAWVDSLPDA